MARRKIQTSFETELEARWAAFLDALGVMYDYHPGGIKMTPSGFKPTFWLPGQQAYLAIKASSDRKPLPLENQKVVSQEPILYVYEGEPARGKFFCWIYLGRTLASISEYPIYKAADFKMPLFMAFMYDYVAHMFNVQKMPEENLDAYTAAYKYFNLLSGNPHLIGAYDVHLDNAFASVG